MISVISGAFGHDKQRIGNFVEFIYCLSQQEGVSYEFILVEQTKDKSEARSFVSAVDRIAVIYGTVVYPRYNISWLFNNGAKRASGDILVFADIDIVFGRTYLRRIEDYMKQHVYAVGWNNSIWLNNAGRDRYIQLRDFTPYWPDSMIETKKVPAYDGGCTGLAVAMDRDFFFKKLGGWNESYFDWGGCDPDIATRAKKVVGEASNLSYTLLHLAHGGRISHKENGDIWSYVRKHPLEVSQTIIDRGCGFNDSPNPTVFGDSHVYT